MVYKLINHLNRVLPDPFFASVNSVTSGHVQRMFKQHCRITPRLKFFTNRVVSQCIHCKKLAVNITTNNSELSPQHVIMSDSL